MAKGIYKITNKRTGEVYIGQTNNLYFREKQHNEDLASGSHHNKGMQEDYNRGDEFSFEVLEYVNGSRKELHEREKAQIKNHNSFYAGYNQTPGGEYDQYKGRYKYGGGRKHTYSRAPTYSANSFIDSNQNKNKRYTRFNDTSFKPDWSCVPKYYHKPNYKPKFNYYGKSAISSKHNINSKFTQSNRSIAIDSNSADLKVKTTNKKFEDKFTEYKHKFIYTKDNDSGKYRLSTSKLISLFVFIFFGLFGAASFWESISYNNNLFGIVFGLFSVFVIVGLIFSVPVLIIGTMIKKSNQNFGKTDKQLKEVLFCCENNEGNFRFSKTKIISWLAFFVSVLCGIIANINDFPGDIAGLLGVFIALIIIGLIFAVPTFMVGWLFHYLLNRNDLIK